MNPPVSKPVIADDGVTHINVYSRGKTAVGRALSNFTYAPFVHPEFGQFASVEGFWYWLGAGANSDNDRMRELYGFSAKLAGAQLHNIPQDEEYFHLQICRAIECKVRQNPEIAALVKESTLPFMHYIVMHEKDYREPGQYRMWPVLKAKHYWQMEFLEGLRRRLKGDLIIDPAFTMHTLDLDTPVSPEQKAAVNQLFQRALEDLGIKFDTDAQE